MIFIIQSPEKRDVSLLVFWNYYYFFCPVYDQVTTELFKQPYTGSHVGITAVIARYCRSQPGLRASLRFLAACWRKLLIDIIAS